MPNSESDHRYHLRRAREEAAAALQASSTRVSAIHARLAEEHRRLAGADMRDEAA